MLWPPKCYRSISPNKKYSLTYTQPLSSGRVYSCGIAACNAVVGLLKTGDHLVSADNIYGGKRQIFLRAFGDEEEPDK